MLRRERGLLLAQRIYVGNLSYDATEEGVRTLFETYGSVLSCSLPTDRETGRARGFGFVEMEPQGAETAIRELDGKDFQGRMMRVNEARPRGEGGQSNRW